MNKSLNTLFLSISRKENKMGKIKVIALFGKSGSGKDTISE